MERTPGSESPETPDSGLVGWFRARYRSWFGQALQPATPPPQTTDAAPEPAAAPRTEPDPRQVALAINAMERTLNEKGVNLRRLQALMERFNLAVDDADVLEYIALSNALGRRKTVRVDIRAGMDFYTTMIEIVREATGRTFSREEVLHEGMEMLERANPHLLLTIDTDDAQTLQDAEVLRFANQIRALCRREAIRFSVLQRGNGPLPSEIGRETSRFTR